MSGAGQVNGISRPMQAIRDALLAGEVAIDRVWTLSIRASDAP